MITNTIKAIQVVTPFTFLMNKGSASSNVSVLGLFGPLSTSSPESKSSLLVSCVEVSDSGLCAWGWLCYYISSPSISANSVPPSPWVLGFSEYFALVLLIFDLLF